MTNQDERRPLRLVLQHSRALTKIVVLAALVLSMAVVVMLGVKITQVQQANAELEAKASQLEQENAALEQKIDNLDTVEGIEDIAKEELGLVDPDTVVFSPES